MVMRDMLQDVKDCNGFTSHSSVGHRSYSCVYDGKVYGKLWHLWVVIIKHFWSCLTMWHRWYGTYEWVCIKEKAETTRKAGKEGTNSVSVLEAYQSLCRLVSVACALSDREVTTPFPFDKDDRRRSLGPREVFLQCAKRLLNIDYPPAPFCSYIWLLDKSMLVLKGKMLEKHRAPVLFENHQSEEESQESLIIVILFWMSPMTLLRTELHLVGKSLTVQHESHLRKLGWYSQFPIWGLKSSDICWMHNQ